MFVLDGYRVLGLGLPLSVEVQSDQPADLTVELGASSLAELHVSCIASKNRMCRTNHLPRGTGPGPPCSQSLSVCLAFFLTPWAAVTAT